MEVARVYTGVADTRYLLIYLLRRARRNLHFDPPKLGDRSPTGELVAPLYHSLLLLQSPSLRTQLWPTGRRSPPSSIIVLWMALYQAGGGRLSTVPCVGFCIAGRGRLSLCGFILQRGKDGFLPSHVRFYIAAGRGQLSTVPRVRFYIAEGEDRSLPSPVFGFYRNWYDI